MPLHSITPLTNQTYLGLWHLTEPAATLLTQLPAPDYYAGLQPAARDPARQAQWAAGRVLAHALLRELTPADTRLRNNPDGQPFFEQLPCYAISLSHSGEWAAALITTKGRVGIDIELIRPKAQRLAQRFLSEAEQANAGDDAATYSLYWSAKETLYKLHSRRGLVFKEQILLDPFRLREAGALTGHLLLKNFRSQHQIYYHCPAAGYILTYCCELNG